MTHVTLPRATVEQALEALEGAEDHLAKPYSTDASKAVVALRAALAQQDEPVAAERERCAEYLMQQAAECRENSPTRVTLESCAAVLRLGLHAQAERVEPVLQTCNCRWDGEVQVQQCTLHEAHVDAIHEWAERAKVAERKLAQQAEPVEPYCYVYEYDGVFGLHREFYPLPYNGMKPSRTVPVYTAPPQRKPLTDEEIRDLWSWSMTAEAERTATTQQHAFTRAVERAHGIKE